MEVDRGRGGGRKKVQDRKWRGERVNRKGKG